MTWTPTTQQAVKEALEKISEYTETVEFAMYIAQQALELIRQEEEK